jgi:DNA-binding MarR family transcriptional regulator
MAQSTSRDGPASAADDAHAALDAASQALFRLGRLFGRQPLADVLGGRAGRPVELSRVLVVQTVADASSAAPGNAGQDEVTVGVVADRLGIDPSTASRLVAEAVRDGYLIRSTSAVDGRRACLKLTETGRALALDSRRYQRAVFNQATQGWSDHDREVFARLFVRFATAIAEHPDLAIGTPGVSRQHSADVPIREAGRA